MIRHALAFLCLPAMAEGACRQALALGLDVSGSVDAEEYRLQLDGLAAALGDPEVRSVLMMQPDAPVRIAVFEWSGPLDQRLVADWTEITDLGALAALQDRLRRHERVNMVLTTALGTALRTGFSLLAAQEECWRRTLDISGDGVSNAGPRPQDVPDAETPAGVIVNGLAVGVASQSGDDDRRVDIKELSAYFEAYLIRGPGAFVEVALGFEDYSEAMRRKLLRELQTLAIGALSPGQ